MKNKAQMYEKITPTHISNQPMNVENSSKKIADQYLYLVLAF